MVFSYLLVNIKNNDVSEVIKSVDWDCKCLKGLEVILLWWSISCKNLIFIFY